ncbi:MAG TPA: GNAT family N-acetyltransferase [Edaphobacter sp.]|jgi:ribosomal-protein-alanine N-acetyltransferase
MSAGFLVRGAAAADVARVVAVERAIAEAPHWAEREYAAMVRGDNAGVGVRRGFFVAEGKGRLLGFAVGKVIGLRGEGVAELESVAVEASVRRGGVGRALCAAVAEWCRGQGVRALELEVRAGSAGAIALYTGLGFVVVGRRVGYYVAPVEDALLMRLELIRDE